MRKLYNYITIDQKIEVLKELQNSLSQLNDELEKTPIFSHRLFVRFY